MLLLGQRPVLSAEGDCLSRNLSTTAPVTAGFTRKKVTQRCIRRVAEGVRVTCDSGEVATALFCEQNGSPSGQFNAMVSSGVFGTRTGVCLWSSITDATAVVNCKLIGKKLRDSSGDAYSKHMHIQQ